MRSLAATIALALVAAGPAAAQERSASERQLLVSLGYVLGEAHALKQACEGPDSQRWRARMTRLLELEQPDQAFRNRLQGSFNEGYAYRAARHAACDADARAANTDTARRGETLARSIVTASIESATRR